MIKSSMAVVLCEAPGAIHRDFGICEGEIDWLFRSGGVFRADGFDLLTYRSQQYSFKVGKGQAGIVQKASASQTCRRMHCIVRKRLEEVRKH